MRPTPVVAMALATTMLAGLLAGCGGGKPPQSAEKPATAEKLAHEAELLKLTLTPQATARLGIRTVAAGSGTSAPRRETHGEIVAAAAGGGVPTSGQTDLAALAVAQARADGDVARARAQYAVAQKAAARAAALVREQAGSVRTSDEAQSAQAVAGADLRTAQAQRALLGPPVATLARQGRLWVRVAVLAGDLAEIDRAAPARVRLLGEPRAPGGSGGAGSGGGDTAGGALARPVNAPPSANAAAGTVDLYYALDNPAGRFRIGQRVAVALAAGAPVGRLAVPDSAILRDAYGGEWVYAETGPHAFVRRRVEIAAHDGGQALLARGVAPGERIVTASAAELFGTEFGAK